MTTICNKLEKLPPPSFVTTATKDWKVVVQKWSSLIVQSKYRKLKNLLQLESNLLTGYIERKGTQLRLEKALMFTKQIQKVLLRWKSNDFYSQLLQFQRSIGNFNIDTGYLISSKSNISKERLPSVQWVRWVIYLALRDAALLAKVCVDCESTIEFWFGLIGAGHHWGDSLVVGGILARLWFISSKIVEDFITVLYATLYEISSLLVPNKSGDWPNEDFSPPANILEWLQKTMNLSFVPVEEEHFTKRIISQQSQAKSGLQMKFFENMFDLSRGTDVDDEDVSDAPLLLESESHGVGVEEEDFGVAIVAPPEKPVRKKKKRNGGAVQAVASNNGEAPEWKKVRVHWNQFFKNYEKKIKSAAGRKKLCIQIKKYCKTESDKKLKIRLKRLKKLMLNSSDEDLEVISDAFSNLQVFLNKYVKRLKKAK